MVSSSILKDIFSTIMKNFYVSTYMCYKWIHNDIIIEIAIKYLKPLSLCLSLPDFTILSISSKYKVIDFLEASTYFFLINYNITNF